MVMRRTILTLVLAGVLTNLASGQSGPVATDWPQWRGPRRDGDARTHRETQPMRLPVIVIRVLPQYQHLHLLDRCEMQSCKHFCIRWKHRDLLPLLCDETQQVLEIRFAGFFEKDGSPGGLHDESFN